MERLEHDLNRVAVILVNYNGKDDLLECIDSLLRSTYRDFSIIVVDNASADDSVPAVKNRFGEEITVMAQPENMGFARANNLAADYAVKNGAEYLLLLNNDTVANPEMLETMMKTASDRVVAVPKIYYNKPGNLLWYAGGAIDRFRGYIRHWGDGEVDSGQFDEGKTVGFASGCCMLIHRRMIQEIGLFDENYFMYFEDVDFCLKLAENHFPIFYEPAAKLRHKASSSSGGGKSRFVIYYTSRNRIYLLRKYRSVFGPAAFIYTYAFLFARWMKAVILGGNARVIALALRDAWSRRMGKREKI